MKQMSPDLAKQVEALSVDWPSHFRWWIGQGHFIKDPNLALACMARALADTEVLRARVAALESDLASARGMLNSLHISLSVVGWSTDDAASAATIATMRNQIEQFLNRETP